MASADILVFSSLLAMSLSVGSLIAVCLVQRSASAQGLRSARENRASEKATIEQLHTAVAHMRVQFEQMRAMSKTNALLEVDRRIETVLSAEFRLRAASDEHKRARPDAPEAWHLARQLSTDFASTEPMGLTADLRLVDSTNTASRSPHRIAVQGQERA